MSDLDEPRIRCPTCAKNVPAMRYCIYCGAQLPALTPSVEKRTANSSRVGQVLPPQVPPPRATVPQVVVTPSVPMSLDNEVFEIMSNIVMLYERKVALLNLLKSGEVLEATFGKLYEEYNDKLNDLLNSRIRKMGELRSRLDERSKRLNEVSLSIEEIGVRYKIGEIDLNTFSQRAEKMKNEEKDLKETVNYLKTNLDRLTKMFADKKPREILNLEIQAKECHEALEKSAGEGKISDETWNNVKSDIEEMIVFFDSLTSVCKEEEKKLKEQLDTLQARYKLSEVPVEDYEKKRRELQEEIDKIWQ